MKKQKFLAMVTCFCMAIGALSACAGNPGTPQATDTEKQVDVETPAPVAVQPADAPADALSGSDALEGEIVFWTMWNETEPQGEAWRDVANAFMEANPGTKITIQWSGRDQSKILKPALESGQQIDIFDYSTQYGGQLGFYVADLSEVIVTPFDSLGGQTLTDVLLPSMIEVPKMQTQIFAGQVAVGYKPWLNLIMYNVAAFEEAGITTLPTTWEELEAACAALQSAGYVPFTFDDAYAHYIPGTYLQRAKGQDWVLELAADSTGELWRDPAVLQMAQAMEDFASKGYFDTNVAGNRWPTGQMDVGMGKVAMYFNLTGLPSELQDVVEDGFRWGAFNFPDVPGGGSYAKNAAAAGVTMTAINSKTENFALAAEFLAFIHSPESDARFVESGMTTSRKDGNWPSDLAAVAPMFDSVTDIIQLAGGMESNPDVKPVFAENFTKLAAGQISADEFVESMVSMVQ